MAGLPDITLADTKLETSIAELKADCSETISAADQKLLYYFFLKYDCLNLVELLMNPDAEINPNGNYTLEQYQDMITSATEMNFNVHRYPAFLSEYARAFAYNKEKPGFFPKDAMMLDYYNYAMNCPNGMIAKWFEFNFNIANILTAMIARKNGWNVSDYVLGDNEVTDMIRNNNTKDFNLALEYDYVADLMKVAEETDPVLKERKIDAFMWNWLDEQTFFNVFSIEAVFAYFCKLEIMERWEHLDVEEGKAKFKQIIENLRGEARVPDEFLR